MNFPFRLAVIRGHKLIQNYALAIYQMKNMETVGLHSLTHILKGGVRIEKNPTLCYVETINWRKIVVDPIHKEHHIVIEENREPQT
jgi:Receptor L domain